MAQDLVGTVGSKLGLGEGDAPKVLATFTGKEIAGTK